MRDIKIFVDSDAVISSLLSKTGATHLLINSNFPIKKYISNLSIKELEKVIVKLSMKRKHLQKTIETFDKVEIIKDSLEKTLGYVHDKNDAHIVAGAIEAKAKFLITYNIKDYKTNKLKTDHNIIAITPGSFLQYLRVLSLD